MSFHVILLPFSFNFHSISTSALPATIQDVLPWWVFVLIFGAILLIAGFTVFLWRQKRQAEYKYSRLAANQTEMEAEFPLPDDAERAESSQTDL